MGEGRQAGRWVGFGVRNWGLAVIIAASVAAPGHADMDPALEAACARARGGAVHAIVVFREQVDLDGIAAEVPQRANCARLIRLGRKPAAHVRYLSRRAPPDSRPPP